MAAISVIVPKTLSFYCLGLLSTQTALIKGFSAFGIFHLIKVVS